MINIAEQLFSSLQAADAGAWDWDIREDRSVWCEHTFAQFGVNPTKGVPSYRAWLERCVHPEDRAHVAEYTGAALRGRDSAFKIEYRIVHPEHGIRWFATRGRIERAESGRAVRIRGLNIDITEQKEIEEKLRKSEERLAVALKASATGVWEWDCATDAVTWSKECLDILGLADFDCTRQAFERLVYPERFRTALGNFLLRGREPYRVRRRVPDHTR